MWPAFIARYFSENPDMPYYLEAVAPQDNLLMVPELLQQIAVADDYSTETIQLAELGGVRYSVFYLPLRDYQGERHPELEPAGMILLWEDVTELVDAFDRSVWVNIIYAVCGFAFLEVLLLWYFNREMRLLSAEKASDVDGLTDLYNRRFFDKTFKDELTLARRSKTAISLIVCDIDYFKQYNDTYGHVEGDNCLRQVAAALKQNLKRSSDWVARYGGEEFAVVLFGTHHCGALEVAGRLRAAVQQLNIPHSGSKVADAVTISLGVATLHPDDETTDFFRRADQGLYRAKEQGRNRVASIQE